MTRRIDLGPDLDGLSRQNHTLSWHFLLLRLSKAVPALRCLCTYPVNVFLVPPPISHRLLNMASPILSFRLMGLPPGISTQVMDSVDQTALASARSVCTHSKKRLGRRLHTTYFTGIGSSLTQDMLERLLWLSEQSQLECHVKSLAFCQPAPRQQSRQSSSKDLDP